jgi:hypothetical protein
MVPLNGMGRWHKLTAIAVRVRAKFGSANSEVST